MVLQSGSKVSVPLCCCAHQDLSRLLADLWSSFSPQWGASLRKGFLVFGRHVQCHHTVLGHLLWLLCLGLRPAVGAEGSA